MSFTGKQMHILCVNGLFNISWKIYDLLFSLPADVQARG